MKGTGPLAAGETAAQRITAHIGDLAGWRGALLARLRAIIIEADPTIVEEWKWGIPVWSRDGIVCTGETYKTVVKMTFAKGAALEDPAGLFTSSLEGRVRRAIDLHEDDALNVGALTALIRRAVALNMSTAKAKVTPRKSAPRTRQTSPQVAPTARKRPARTR